ncbi:MAG TPA: DUF6443 domain-containing protein [Chryseolinea sp.]|nr:DUF6443 domain-containing protein [Chryseolinea sp.]
MINHLKSGWFVTESLFCSLSKIMGVMLISLAASGQSNKPVAVTQVPVYSGVLNTRPADYPSNTNLNYVRTWTAKGAYVDVSTFQQATAGATGYTEVNEQTNYLDGLGRPLQAVAKQVSPGANPKDVVTPVVYDQWGREIIKYLPYVQSNNVTNDGSFRKTAFTDQDYFYKNIYKDASNNLMYNGEQVLYSRIDYETSPLNRTKANFAPGNSWAGSYNPANPANEKAVKQQYLVNVSADAVRVWNIAHDALAYTNNDIATNIPLAETNPYGVGDLFKTVAIDEGGNAVVEYRDRDGQVILKKVQAGTIASDFSGYTGFLCTYYIYDELHQLRFVIPPKAVVAIGPTYAFTDDIINELCFRYEYDGRQRMIAKKIPGAGWTYMTYDTRDRLVFTQDANMRAGNQWMVMLYDALDRVRITGMITYAGTPAALQTTVTSQTQTPASPGGALPVDLVLSTANTIGVYNASGSIAMETGFETTTGGEFTAEILTGWSGPDGETSTIEGIEINKNPIPPGATMIALTISYFDSYAWTAKTYTTQYNSNLDPGANLHAETLPAVTNVRMLGIPTGSKVRTLDDPNNLAAGSWLSTANFYDEKGRMIQAQTDNYKGGTDIIANMFDFTGKLLSSYSVHNDPVTTQVRIGTDMSYDAEGRMLKTWKTINDDHAKKALIAENSYDDLGQLLTKKLGRIKNSDGSYSSLPLETLDYNYNIRGWLTGINKDFANDVGTTTNDRWFGMQLNYDWGFANNQFNGNVSGIKWRSKGDGERRGYGFGYDKLNRLLSGDFSQFDPSLGSYADNATINFDMQMGDGVNTSSAYDENGNIKAMKQWGLKITGSTPIDDMVYSYFLTSNKLSAVTEQNTGTTDHKLGDFTDKHTGSDDYGYDKNGNLVTDLNKRINGSTGVDVTSGGAISYNHLNLLWQVRVKDDNGNQKGTITYTYDAAGNKLKKVTVESASAANNNITTTTTTIYVAGMVYESKTDNDPNTTDYADKLQFMGQEEGRIRATYADAVNPNTLTGFEYDYMIRDHLGNVRMLLTEERKQDKYPVASLETTKLTTETAYYTIDQTKIVDATSVSSLPAYTNDNGIGNNPADASFEAANSQELYRLNAMTNKTGLGITLKIMSGDKIDIHGKSYWINPNTGGSGANMAPAVLDLLNGLLGSPGSAALNSHTTATELNGIASVNSPIGNYITLPGRDNSSYSTRPKAFINYLFLDEQFRYAGGGVSAVSNTAGIKDHFSELQDLVAPKNGYVYIYVSNESPVNVFFDNLQVVHTRGALLEETHYYPFGLTMAGISSKALSIGVPENKKKFNQGTELNTDFDINLYETSFRGYEAQIGRFHQIDLLANLSDDWSPYVFASNNPILRNDPLGLKDTIVNDEKGETKDLENVTVTSSRRKTAPTISSKKDYLSPMQAFAPAITVGSRGGWWGLVGAVAVGAINYGINGPSMQEAINEALLMNQERMKKWAEEIVANIDVILAALEEWGGQKETLYELYTVSPGTYKYLKGGTYWKLFEVETIDLPGNATWKYGTTKQPNVIGGPGQYPARYNPGQVSGLESLELYTGTRPQVYAMQAYYIAQYFLKHGDLPPGNKAVF